jgi:hypothetical protein
MSRINHQRGNPPRQDNGPTQNTPKAVQAVS